MLDRSIPFGKVLSQQTVGVLVRATLPGMLRISEVYLDVGRETEASVIGQFLSFEDSLGDEIFIKHIAIYT